MSGPQEHRVLRLTVDVLKARRRLPHQNPLATSAAWLRPNWPDVFVLTSHRGHVVQLLMDDADLRAEVAKKLGPGLLRDTEQPTDAKSMQQALIATSEPEQVLQSVAVNPNSAIAILSQPYLLGSIPVPQPPVIPANSTTTSRPIIQSAGARRELREAHAIERRLEAELQAARVESERLRRQLQKTEEDLAAATAKARQLQSMLPTRKQQRALDTATLLAAELRRTKRTLEKARTAKANELQQARLQTAAAERELQRVHQALEREQRGRRRLAQELGDAPSRARRLLPFVQREAATTRQQAVGERPGPHRSRHIRRADEWQQLAALLTELFDLNEPAETTNPVTELVPAPVDSAPVQVKERGLRVTALGGSNHIGGSALLVEAGDTRILIDAGLRPQAHASHPGPPRINEAIAARLDAIVITHAHADHAGYVPWVTEQQRQAKIFCSPQTAALLPTVWADSVRVMRAEADSASAFGAESVEPPYGDAEVSHSEEALVSLPYGRSLRVRDVDITLFQAGHILGAAGVVIQAGDERVVITGDIDDRTQASVAAAQIPPRLARAANLLVIETTYCDSIHNDRQQEGASLVAEAEGILATGGRILVPAFGLGRAQEIALLLGEQLPNVDVLIDGLARNISELYALQGAPEVLRGRVRKVTNRAREILGFHTGIVITTSGMLTGGAAVPWAEAVLQEPLSALFLCGHQDEDSPGKELELLASSDPESPRDVRLRGATGQPTTIKVAAKVVRYNLSAHADRTGLNSIVEQVDPQAIMLVHGEPGPQRAFRQRWSAADAWSSTISRRGTAKRHSLIPVTRTSAAARTRPSIVIDKSFSAWLSGRVAHDALLIAWRRSIPPAATNYESDALAISALAIQHNTDAGIGQPGGRARLPLLAAVHAAALQLSGYPSPFAPPQKGPVVLVTRQVIRRVELENIDGAGVPICPAIRPVRIRSDDLCVPLHGGRAHPQTPFNLLLLTGDLSGRPIFAPAAVIIDGANVDDAFLEAATGWAHELGAPTVVFDDAARRRWPEGTIIHSSGWAAINAATSSPDDAIATLATLRGHAAVVDIGPEADLAAAAALLADARRRGPFPPALVEAATLWRRLDEMVVPLSLYDAACPRWHTPPLSERLDDLSKVRASDFPSGWRTWAEACWAGIKDGLISSRSTLTKPGAKAAAFVHLVDDELLAGRSVDVALPSRTARDSAVHYLAEAGVLVPDDGRLTIRSLGDVEAWGPPRATLVAAPPTRMLRHRLTAADVGALNVLCYTHETGALMTCLRHNLDEPLKLSGPVSQLGPAALTFDLDLPATRPAIVLTSLARSFADGADRRADLAHLAAAPDIAALAALKSRPEDELSELPGDDVDSDVSEPDMEAKNDGPRAVVPITVVALGQTQELTVRVAVQRTALRVLGDTVVRIPVLDIQPSMLIADIAGPTAFERLRPMLEASRGPATQLFLAAWYQALHIAEQRSSGTTGLATTLRGRGSAVGRAAVASWTDEDRIGPRSADDVERIGKIAEHPVVIDNSAAIAAVMVHLRTLHQAVGKAIGGAIATSIGAIETLNSILGSDALSVINETIVYRVIKVGRPTVDRGRENTLDDTAQHLNREQP